MTERNPDLSEQMGKVTNCDNVVMSHSLNYTLLYLTSHFHVNELVFKKNVVPFYSVKVAPEAATSKLFITFAVYLCSWVGEKLSVIWQHLHSLFPPRSSVGVAVAKNLYNMKETAAEVNSLVQCYAGWQSKRRSKTTIWLAASTGHPPHSFVFSLSQ